MLNKTKLRIQGKATLKIVKSMFEGIGEKYNQGTAEAIQEIKSKIKEMEKSLKGNDGKIEKMEKQYESNDMKVQQQHYVTEKQRKVVAEETRKLQELEAVENGMKKTNGKLKDEINRIKSTQSKIQNEYLRAIEELAELETIEQEEVKLLNAPEEENQKESKKSFFGKKKEKEKEKEKVNYHLHLKGNIFEHKDVAENLRLKMHQMVDVFGENEELKMVLHKTDKTLQFKFVDKVYKGEEEIAMGTYYFKTSADANYELITMHKEEGTENKKEIKKIADGEKIFAPRDVQENIDIYNEIARKALKSLGLLQNQITDELENREKKEEVLFKFDDKQVILKNAK